MLSLWLAKIRGDILEQKQRLFISKGVQAVQPIRASTDAEIVRTPKKTSHFGQNVFLTGRKIFAKILPSGFFSSSCIDFFSFCLQVFFFSHENRKYGECDLISLLGKGTITKDIFI